ncbi:dTDP-4-dehydrorhamnose 3,5-epimerase [Halodurantibacterium flavum]|uniref:dTDP-4-dehydrorhamnose 3,5-epimerase n=1 Tax=Halodurantibacterium flavum TaxID=1382802 RepID=A0ABW4S7F4_9RHOB
MKVIPGPLPGLLLIEPKRHGDARGWFSESWNRARLADAGLTTHFVQDNESFSRHAGTVRGLHFQAPPHAQAKLVRAVAGAIRDVVVDIRRASPGFGQWAAFRLSAENGRQLFVPEGFLHGFVTETDATLVQYKCSAPYAAAAEGAVRFDDSRLGIDWGLPPGRAILSPRDAAATPWADFVTPF